MQYSKNKYNLNKISVALLSIISTSFTLPVLAENSDEDKKLEVITVTAQKRSQNIKDVPISMTAISPEKLQEANINNAEDLSANISNFSVSQNAQGFNITMRGLGSGPNQGFEQTVGTFVDGIYRGRAHLMRSVFLDLERIEVLRGPQSALFGKNTTAGALNLTNAKPTEDLRGYFNTRYNFDFNETIVEGAISNSLAENLQGRIALKYVDGGGYLKNTRTNRDEIDHQTFLGRISLAWQPTDKINVAFSYQHDNDDLDGAANNQIIVEPLLIDNNDPILAALVDYTLDDKVYKTNPDVGEEEKAHFKADHLTLNIEYDMDDLTFNSITGWQSYKLKQSDDAEASPLALIYREYGHEDYEQLSQEFRLTSSYDGDFNYIMGLYFQTSELDYDENYLVYPLSLAAIKSFDVDTDTSAIFTQLDYKFSTNWEATLGLRYSIEEKDGHRNMLMHDLTTGIPFRDSATVTVPASGQVVPASFWLNAVLNQGQNLWDHNITVKRKEKHFTPTLNIKYKMDNAMLYAAVAKGAKAGGFDARANTPTDIEFEDEKVTSVEVGGKFTLDDGAADINISIFSMKFKNLQTSVYDGNVGFFVQNGAKATSNGIEIDGRWQFVDNWLLSGSLGLLDFKWDDFSGAKCFRSAMYTPDHLDESGESCDLSGKRNAFAPKFSGSVSLEYFTEFNEDYELKTNLDLIHKSDYYTNTDINPFTEQEAYTKVNFRVALINTSDNWTLALLGKNLTDEITVPFSIDAPTLPAGVYTAWTEPGRSVSLQLDYNF